MAKCKRHVPTKHALLRNVRHHFMVTLTDSKNVIIRVLTETTLNDTHTLWKHWNESLDVFNP